MGWLDWAVDDPAPGNCGYSGLNVPCEVDPSLRHGGTIHSVWGYFTHVNPSAVMGARGSSWDTTVMRSGQTWRHRPRPTFVSWHGGGPAQNIGTWAMEVEGKDEPWTPEQKESILRVCRETWDWFGWTDVVLGGPTDKTQNGIRQALLAAGYGSLWEHNWFDYTSCPMGRNDWGWLMAALEEEGDDMPLNAEDKAFIVKTMNGVGRNIVQATADGVVGIRFGADDPGWKPPHSLKDVLTKIEAIPGGGGGGLSAAQLEAALTRALKNQKWVVE